MKRLSFILMVVGFVMWIGNPVFPQGLEPIYQARFNEDTFDKTGWSFFQSGVDYEPAIVFTGLIPSSPTSLDFTDGKGVTVTALPGQGSFIYGPVIPTDGHLALIKISVLALSGGGSIAVGALNVLPSGSISTTNSSVSYAYETDSGKFVGDYQYITVLYRPQNKALIPIFQLAVAPSDSRTSVSAMFDNMQVYLLNEDTVSDPLMRQALGIQGSSSTATPTSTPTVTPTPIDASTPTPTATPDDNPPAPGTSFTVDTFYTVTSDNDQMDAYNPRVAYDRDDSFAIVAADLGGGYQDITLRKIDAAKKIVDGPFTVNETFEDTVAQTPDIDVDFGGLRHIAWSDNRSVEKLFSIYLAQVDSFGARRVNSDFEVNNLFESTNAAEPALSVLDNGDMVVCWRDDRNFLMDAFVRRLHWDGGNVSLIDAKDFQINVPYNNTNVSHPDIAMTDGGAIVAVWSDDRVLVDGVKRNDIYARVFTKSTAYIEDTRQLDDSVLEVQVSGVDNMTDSALHPQVAHQDGKFVIVWQNQEADSSDSFIHAAVLDGSGNVLQQEFSVEAGVETSQSQAPSVSPWEDGQFYITWFNKAGSQLVGRVYDAEKHLFTSDPVILVNNVASTEQTSNAVSSNSRAFMVWDGVIRSFRDIYGASLTVAPVNGLASIPEKISPPEKPLSPMSVKILSKEDGRRDLRSKAERAGRMESAAR